MKQKHYSTSVIALGTWFVLLGMVLCAVTYGSAALNWLVGGSETAHTAGVPAVATFGDMFLGASKLWPVPVFGAGVLLIVLRMRRPTRL